MKTLLNHAAQVISGYKNNPIIMKFINNEALEKVASDIRAKTNSGTTAKAVELLLASGNDKTIKQRFDAYVNVGLIACYSLAIEGAAS